MKRSADGTPKKASTTTTAPNHNRFNAMADQVQLICPGRKSAIEIPKDKIAKAGAYFRDKINSFIVKNPLATAITLKLPFDCSSIDVLVRWLLGRPVYQKDDANGYVGDLEQLSGAYSIGMTIKNEAFQNAVMDALHAVLVAYGKALRIAKVVAILLEQFHADDMRCKLVADWLVDGEFDAERSTSDEAARPAGFNKILAQAFLHRKINGPGIPWKERFCRYHTHQSSTPCTSKRLKVES